MQPEELQEYPYRAVREVLAGSPIGEVAERYGTSRQSLHMGQKRFEQEGMPGPADRSRRPKTSPGRTAAEVEARCVSSGVFTRGGGRRIRYELLRRGVDPTPSRATVHRVLVRNGLVAPQVQDHKRQYKRWQRAAPMQLWQMDLVGGVFLADGRECKMAKPLKSNGTSVMTASSISQASSSSSAASATGSALSCVWMATSCTRSATGFSLLPGHAPSIVTGSLP